MKKKNILLIISILCIAAFVFAGCGKTKDASAPTAGSAETMPPFMNDTGDFLSADKFSFSGGTGKVGISCESITGEPGNYNALLVLDSDAYTYVRVGETKYNCSHEEGKSWAAIPVTVNENNTIYAETTKMSQPHEIEYQIFIYIDEEHSGADAYALLKTNELDETAPFIPGLEIVQEEAVSEGVRCKIFSYENGISLLEVTMKETEGAMLDSMDYAAYTTKAQAVEDAQAELYTKNVIKYILAPEGAKLPAGIEKEAIVITTPASKIYSDSLDITPKELVAGKYDVVLIDSSAFSDGGEGFAAFAETAATLGIPVIAAGTEDIPAIQTLLQ